MSLNFPSPPTPGQVFGEYTWDGEKWNKAGSGDAVVSSTPPSGAKSGDLWWDKDDGELYVYFHDGTSGQWVASTSTGVPVNVLDFPSSPSVGQSYETYSWDGEKWIALVDSGSGPFVLKVGDTMSGGLALNPLGSIALESRVHSTIWTGVDRSGPDDMVGFVGNTDVLCGRNWTWQAPYASFPSSEYSFASISAYGNANHSQQGMLSITTSEGPTLAISHYAFAYANRGTAEATGAWPIYSEGHRFTPNDYCYGLGEHSTVNRVNHVELINPLNVPAGSGTTFGVVLNAGNSNPASEYLQYSCSNALLVQTNGGVGQTNLKGFAAGITFRTGSLDQTIYNPPHAMELAGGAEDHAIVWYSSPTNISWTIDSPATSGTNRLTLGNTTASFTSGIDATGAISSAAGLRIGTGALGYQIAFRVGTDENLVGFSGGADGFTLSTLNDGNSAYRPLRILSSTVNVANATASSSQTTGAIVTAGGIGVGDHGFFGGNITLKPLASATPAVNGQMTFELTSNTQLKIKVKGSDGVVRAATLTLA